MTQSVGLTKFAWVLLVLQITFVAIFCVMVRYAESADAKHTDNQLGKNKELKENLEKYPAILDIHMMLLGGFGFLMTFLKRYSFSALGLTFIVTAVVTEWSILLWGFTKMEGGYTIHITFLDVLEGGLTAASVLISLGAVLGKLNPLQVLVMSLVAASAFTLNAYIGYKVLGAIDVGGSIFIHIFGAYFGIAASLVGQRKRSYAVSEHVEGSRYTSDIFSMIGTVLLWIFWPSFNGVLAHNDAYQRAVMNTYLSLLGSTVATMVVSSFFGDKHRFDIIDLQNASLSGGVAVGAIADLMLQPFGALIAGTLTGTISTLGFRWLQAKLFDKIKLHDTCGVHNLHGIPGVISGLASVLVCALATEEIYGPSLYLIFPRAAPLAGSEELRNLQAQLPDMIEAGEGRPMGSQALMQFIAVAITLGIAIVTGVVTGLILNVSSLFDPLSDYELFNDEFFWSLPKEMYSEEDDHNSRQQQSSAGGVYMLDIQRRKLSQGDQQACSTSEGGKSD